MSQILDSLRSVLDVSPPRIAFVRSGALGDHILLLPTIRLLQEHNPDASMRVIGSTWARRIQPLTSPEWDFAPYDSVAMTQLFTDDCRSLPPMLADTDAIIVYTSNPEGPMVSNIRHLHRGPVLTHRLSPPPHRHAAAHLATAITGDPPDIDDLPFPRLQASAEIVRSVSKRIKEPIATGKPLVLFHPGSGSREKCWPPHRYAELAESLHAQDINMIGLRGPADREQCRRVTHQYPSLEFFVNADIEQVAGLLSAVSVCVTNDSGIGHLSAALGTPTVSIFGPTSPEQWRPLGPKTRVLQETETGEWPSPQRVSDVLMKWL